MGLPAFVGNPFVEHVSVVCASAASTARFQVPKVLLVQVKCSRKDPHGTPHLVGKGTSTLRGQRQESRETYCPCASGCDHCSHNSCTQISEVSQVTDVFVAAFDGMPMPGF